MTRQEFEQKMIALCRSWVDVPFLNNGRAKSQGVDCLGLLLCVFKEMGIDVQYKQEFYRPDWFKHTKEERYMAGLFKYGTPVTKDEILPGDVLYFKPQLLSPAKLDRITHAGISVGRGEFIHALTGRAVQIGNMKHGAWIKTYAGAMRVNAVMDLLGESY